MSSNTNSKSTGGASNSGGAKSTPMTSSDAARIQSTQVSVV